MHEQATYTKCPVILFAQKPLSVLASLELFGCLRKVLLNSYKVIQCSRVCCTSCYYNKKKKQQASIGNMKSKI
jgi:hypothetical protein